MELRQISFCNKTYYNITNDSFKKIIINKLSNKNINIIEKYSIYNKKKHRELILNNNFIFSYVTKGNNYILFFTKINNIKYSFFIDRKINKGYIYPRILLVYYRVDNHIYDDTILCGDLILSNKSLFFISDIYYYCGYNLHKYNIFDRLNNIKKFLTKQYISDYNIEPCELLIKKYYSLDNIHFNDKNNIGIEFKSLYFNKLIYYPIYDDKNNKNNYKNSNNNINNNKNIHKNKIFKISKTNQIDIYNLFCMKKKQLYKIGIARINADNSNFLYNYFNDKNLSHKKTIECSYHKKFNKWTPIQFSNNDIDDYFDIKEFLNKNI